MARVHDVEHAVAHDHFALARQITDELCDLFCGLELVLVMAAE